jgi:hypothetical protein
VGKSYRIELLSAIFGQFGYFRRVWANSVILGEFGTLGLLFLNWATFESSLLLFEKVK